ncbi:uncharacterized protein LOC122866258 isoform X2 [Siniperca chuatsi]|uniref:uncharacterized protein LOC122866258 isoform X2 n=1 Tax=Siniperca chuatsi TaxID=119488 RepID=UPI001CE169B6|nr:uncharacterized protein LOC122866258 isoform X2 [Siniperca chuatsi]
MKNIHQRNKVWGVKTNTEKAGKMGTFDATRSVSSASTHLHHCHISWSQGCEVIRTSGPSAMFSKLERSENVINLQRWLSQMDRCHLNNLIFSCWNPNMWMAFCQLGLAPSAAVSTLKSEGQRGDRAVSDF